jgi:hypothetical protein
LGGLTLVKNIDRLLSIGCNFGATGFNLAMAKDLDEHCLLLRRQL